MLSFDDAVAITMMRVASDSPLKRHMMVVRDRYNGDIVIPTSGVGDEQDLPVAVPHFVADAIDGIAMRAASTQPSISVPALKDSELSHKKAWRRRRAYYAVWHQSHLPLRVRRAYRHLAGYGTDCMVVVPDHRDGLPKIETRDPLSAYPDEMSAEEVRLPVNVAFVYPRSAAWIARAYPEAADHVATRSGRDLTDSWDLFEWTDEHQIFQGILGPRLDPMFRTSGARGPIAPFLLRRWDNKAGLVPVVCPARVTLDRMAGQITKLVPLIDWMARLMALETIAAERGVFPDRYIITDPAGPFHMEGERWKDGREPNSINVLGNTKQVGQMVDTTSQNTFQVLSLVERSIRHSGGEPSLFAGELSGAIRSGQTITQAGAYAIDPRVQEAQEIMAYQLGALNEAVAACFTGYWPDQKYFLFSGWPTDQGHVEFTPGSKENPSDFESNDNVVTYGSNGADVNQISVAIGGIVQAGLMSHRSGMRKHPLIDDDEAEGREIIVEQVRAAVLASVQQQAASGVIPPIDVAEILAGVEANGDIVDAVRKSQERAQRRQAEIAPPPGPGQLTAPEAQPGLGEAGLGAEQPQAPPAQGGAPPGPEGLARLLGALQAPPPRR